MYKGTLLEVCIKVYMHIGVRCCLCFVLVIRLFCEGLGLSHRNASAYPRWVLHSSFYQFVCHPFSPINVMGNLSCKRTQIALYNNIDDAIIPNSQLACWHIQSFDTWYICNYGLILLLTTNFCFHMIHIN